MSWASGKREVWSVFTGTPLSMHMCSIRTIAGADIRLRETQQAVWAGPAKGAS